MLAYSLVFATKSLMVTLRFGSVEKAFQMLQAVRILLTAGGLINPQTTVSL